MFHNIKEIIVRYISLIKSVARPIKIGELKKDLLSMWYIYADKLKNLAETNFKLGIYHFERGNLNDAIFRFKLLKIFCRDKYPASDYYLTRCYIEKFKYAKADIFLAHYCISGDSVFTNESKYCKKLISNELKSISKLPDSVVAHNLDKLAYSYIKDGKISPIDCSSSEFKVIANIVKVSDKPFGNNILHIGSRFGKFGKLCRDERIANVINGIEVSRVMYKIAASIMHENTKVYQHIDLIISFEDVFKNLNSCIQYDIIILSDIFSYLFNVKFIISSLNSLLHEKSLLLVSFEKTINNKNTVFIRETERFAHNAQCIKNFMKENSFKLLYEGEKKISNNQKIAIIAFAKFSKV